jgi:hypothetical protein
MATPEKFASDAAQLPRGTVSACTPADRAALTDFYRATYPQATAADLAANIRDEEAAAWVTYRDDQDEIRVAMFLRADGVVWLFAKPEECESPEVQHGFMRLAEEARAALAPYGVQGLSILYPANLEPLARTLECCGVLSKQVIVLRTLHFEAGKVALRN